MQKDEKFYLNEGIYGVYSRFKSLIRFAIVGIINTGVDFSVFAILHSLFGIDKLVCQIAGYSMGIINSFILNKLWTFENTNSKFGTVNQIVRFICINIISLSVSLIGLQVLNAHYGLNIYISKILVTVIAQAVNYFGYKLLVFINR
jgi:putative flippase GtrA